MSRAAATCTCALAQARAYRAPGCATSTRTAWRPRTNEAAHLTISAPTATSCALVMATAFPRTGAVTRSRTVEMAAMNGTVKTMSDLKRPRTTRTDRSRCAMPTVTAASMSTGCTETTISQTLTSDRRPLTFQKVTVCWDLGENLSRGHTYNAYARRLFHYLQLK